jgi:hypothetical protein
VINYILFFYLFCSCKKIIYREEVPSRFQEFCVSTLRFGSTHKYATSLYRFFRNKSYCSIGLDRKYRQVITVRTLPEVKKKIEERKVTKGHLSTMHALLRSRLLVTVLPCSSKAASYTPTRRAQSKQGCFARDRLVSYQIFKY